MSEALSPLEVTGLDPAGPGAWVLRARRPWSFEPGQVVGLAADPADPVRWYSLASGPKDPEIRVLFTLESEGLLTPRLAAWRPGTPLWATAPRGQFLRRPGPGLWIAGGTGVAPFVSYAAAGLTEGQTLLQGARQVESLYFRAELSRALGAAYQPCVAGSAEAGVFSGRLFHCVRDRALDPGAWIYLCGSPSFVVDLRDLLVSKGAAFDRILSEIYF